jgi:hypothetical protein
MKVEFNKDFRTIEGEIIPESTEKQDRPFTLKAAAINALLNSNQETISGEESLKRYDLAVAINSANDEGLDLTAELVTLIKSQIAKTYSPLIVGQAWKMLEGKV